MKKIWVYSILFACSTLSAQDFSELNNSLQTLMQQFKTLTDTLTPKQVTPTSSTTKPHITKPTATSTNDVSVYTYYKGPVTHYAGEIDQFKKFDPSKNYIEQNYDEVPKAQTVIIQFITQNRVPDIDLILAKNVMKNLQGKNVFFMPIYSLTEGVANELLENLTKSTNFTGYPFHEDIDTAWIDSPKNDVAKGKLKEFLK